MAMATAPSTTSVTSIHTVERTIIRIVPVEYGIGASTAIAVSLSTPARPTRSPSGRCWCHEIGWRTRRSTTPPASDAPTANCVIPANTRRTTTPRARTSPTAPRNSTPVTSAEVATSPSSKRGRMTLSVTHLTATLDSTVHVANTAAPATATEKGRGCRRTIAVTIHSPRRNRPGWRCSGGDPICPCLPAADGVREGIRR